MTDLTRDRLIEAAWDAQRAVARSGEVLAPVDLIKAMVAGGVDVAVRLVADDLSALAGRHDDRIGSEPYPEYRSYVRGLRAAAARLRALLPEGDQP